MEVCFNELSADIPVLVKEEMDALVDKYVSTLVETRNHGVKKVRYEHGIDGVVITNGYTLQQYCISNLKGPNHNKATLLLSMQKRPYIDEDTEAEEAFINKNVTIKIGNEIRDTYGIAAAYALNTYCVGFHSLDFWGAVLFQIHVASETEQYDDTILCISLPEGFSAKEYIEWEDSHIAINPDLLPTCQILPEKKKLHIREDHGMDVLKALAKRLRHCEYIVGVINSLPYNPHATSSISQCYADGIIEIVLTKTDKGLGLVIQSTGKNLRQTKWIADYIDRKFLS